MRTSIKTTTFKNMAYNAAAKVITFSLSTVTSIVLARNLMSSDYGVAGFAFIFMNFLTQFSDFGINSAIIQKKNLEDRALYTGFTIKFLLGIIFSLALFVFAPLSARFFDNSGVVNVIRLLSLNIIINIFSFLPHSLLTRDLSYGKLIMPQIGAAMANSAVSIVLALKGFSYWSIVIGNICSITVSTAILNFIRPIKLKLDFDKKTALELSDFGGKLFLYGVIVFAVFNTDNFIVGTVGGSALLGNYALAFNWGTMICGLLTATVLVVLFPTFSKFQEDRSRIKEAYLHAMHTTAMLSILANMCLFIIAKEFLVFVLGHGTDKWMPAFVTLRIFCIYGICRSLLEPMGIVLVAVGRTGPLLRAAVLAAVIEIGLLYPALKYYGIEGVAVLVAISYVTQYSIYVPALKSEMQLQIGEVVSSINPAVISGLITALSVELLLGRDTMPISVWSGGLKLLVSFVSFIGIHGVLSKWQFMKEVRSVVSSMRA